MTVQEITPEMMKYFKLPAKTGVTHYGRRQRRCRGRCRDSVPRTLILEINRQKITSPEDYAEILSRRTAVRNLSVRIKRNGAFFFVTLSLPEEKKP